MHTPLLLTNSTVSMTKIKDSSSHHENKNQLESNCAEIYAINLLRGQWVLSICYHLRGKKLRFSDLKDRIGQISDRMLTLQLKAMEKNRLIERHVFAEVPPRVEYSLSEIAQKMLPVLDELENWGKLHKAYSVESK